MKMVMPKMGMTMEEGTVVEWKKKEGEYVEKGEIILEIMTNKVNIDVEAPASGYLQILKSPDEVVPVGEVIALIEEKAGAEKVLPEVEIPVREPEKEKEKEVEIPVLKPEIEEPLTVESRTRIPASPKARKLAEEKGVFLEDITGTGPGGAVTEKDVLRKIGEEMPGAERPEVSAPSGAVSPLAERIAREKGADLSQVRGTGLGGKITKEDVLRYIERGRKGEGAPEVVVRPEVEIPVMEKPGEPAKPEEIPEEIPGILEEAVPQPSEKPEIPREPVSERVVEPVKPEIPEGRERIPLKGIRKLTAERMSKSKREAPHLTLGMKVDMTEASKLKDSLNITYTDILVKATALALKKHPILNSTLQENSIVLREAINIGIAVARGEDLLVPVIHDADNHSLKEIARMTRDVIERTRNDQLTEKDVLDGTFTISNLGMYGIDFFTPIINPPEAAILGVGEIKKNPVVIDDGIQIREQITLSLSFDHRIVNGMPAALFLQEIKTLLEHPYKLFVEGES